MNKLLLTTALTLSMPCFAGAPVIPDKLSSYLFKSTYLQSAAVQCVKTKELNKDQAKAFYNKQLVPTDKLITAQYRHLQSMEMHTHLYEVSFEELQARGVDVDYSVYRREIREEHFKILKTAKTRAEKDISTTTSTNKEACNTAIQKEVASLAQQVKANKPVIRFSLFDNSPSAASVFNPAQQKLIAQFKQCAANDNTLVFKTDLEKISYQRGFDAAEDVLEKMEVPNHCALLHGFDDAVNQSAKFTESEAEKAHRRLQKIRLIGSSQFNEDDLLMTRYVAGTWIVRYLAMKQWNVESDKPAFRRGIYNFLEQKSSAINEKTL